MAEAQSKEYVEYKKLQIMFLWDESFDAKRAAQRMFRFFQNKVGALWTHEACTRYNTEGSEL
jgi:hypothetical protein